MRKVRQWIERHVYYYICKVCLHRRYSFKKSIQKLEVCRKCRQKPENTGQLNWLDENTLVQDGRQL